MERQSKEKRALPQENRLSLTTNELCLLGVCMGYVSVPDLGAELPGFSKEHLGIVLPTMVQELEERGMLKSTFGHAPQVQEEYREMVATVFDPEALVDFTVSRHKSLRCFMRGDTCIAINGEGVIYAFAGRQALCDALHEVLPQKEGKPVSFSLPLETAEEVKSLYNSFRKGEVEALLQAHLIKEKRELWLTLLSGACPQLEICLWSHESSSYCMEASSRFVFMEEGMFQIVAQEGCITLRGVSGEALQKTIEGYCEKQEVTRG